MSYTLKTFTSLLLFLSISIGNNAQEKKETHQNTLDALVKKYYELNIIAFQPDSKVADIDNIFNLFTDDFTYTHLKYGGVYKRNVLYKGYLRNQKNGMYDGAIKDVKILNKIIGLDAVVVNRAYIEKTKNGLEQGETRMTLFEFKEGKISKIVEYW